MSVEARLAGTATAAWLAQEIDVALAQLTPPLFDNVQDRLVIAVFITEHLRGLAMKLGCDAGERAGLDAAGEAALDRLVALPGIARGVRFGSRERYEQAAVAGAGDIDRTASAFVWSFGKTGRLTPATKASVAAYIISAITASAAKR